jgi:hypothetical protein
MRVARALPVWGLCPPPMPVCHAHRLTRTRSVCTAPSAVSSPWIHRYIAWRNRNSATAVHANPSSVVSVAVAALGVEIELLVIDLMSERDDDGLLRAEQVVGAGTQ